MRIFSKIKGIKGFATLRERVLRFRYMITAEAKRRTEILAFWEKYGTKATEDAFKVMERTLFRWQKALREGNGKLEALNKQSEEEEAKRRTGITCPVCKEGDMSERKGRFGIFYSCSNYPKCKYAIKAKPTGNLCPTCGALMMEGTKTIPERCSDKACPNHNPHKLEK